MITRIAIWLLAASLVVGQLVRIPVAGQSGGLLVSDIAVVIVLLVAVFQSLRGTKKESGLTTHPSTSLRVNYLLLTTPFILWSAFTLAVHYGEYSPEETTIAFFYWLRTTCYLLLLPALLVLAQDTTAYRVLRQSFSVAVAALVAVGWLQLLLWPNLAAAPAWLLRWTGGGWDPHLGRAVSTWLDPNFFGMFLCLAVLYCLSRLFSSAERPLQLGWLALGLATGGLLIATQSRSSLVALAGALLLVSPLLILRLIRQQARSLLPLLAGAAGLISIVGFLAALALGERWWGLFGSDPTVALRAESLRAVWPLAEEHSLTGVGYNAYQFAAQAEGLINDFSLHSRAGADNSFLTLAVTTGVTGVLLFILPWLAATFRLLRRWLVTGNGAALAAAAGILTLTIHSQFINSWLYAHLLVSMAILIALAEAEAYDSTAV